MYMQFKLPRPVTLSTIMYISSILGYNIYGTYAESSLYLHKYRENTLHELVGSNIKYIKNDWYAVNYGAKVNACDRFWNSLIWPIISITDIVPLIVLGLNPKKKE